MAFSVRQSTQNLGIHADPGSYILGCDPGPEHCALALMKLDTDYSFEYLGCAYPKYQELISDMEWSQRGWAMCLDDMPCHFEIFYEKVMHRFGMTPGQTVYDTARNSGIMMAAMALYYHHEVNNAYALGSPEWRAVFGGTPRLKDSETHARIIDLLGSDQDKKISQDAKILTKHYREDNPKLKPVAGHIRDAVAVAISGFYLPSAVKQAHNVWTRG